MRLGVVEHGVVVDVLAARHEVQPVEQAVGAFAVEHGTRVVPGDRGAEVDVVRGVPAVSSLAAGHRGDVPRRGPLDLQPRMLERGVVADERMRHRVRQRPRVALADEGLDDPGAAVRTGHDQRARLLDRFRGLRAEGVDDLDRVLDRGPGLDDDDRAVAQERLVERFKGSGLVLAPAEPITQLFTEVPERVGEGPGPQACRGRARGGDRLPARKHEARAAQSEIGQGVLRLGARLRGNERDFVERGDVGSTPRFHFRCGQARGVEPLAPGATQIGQPGVRRLGLLAGERVECGVQSRHARSASSLSSQP